LAAFPLALASFSAFFRLFSFFFCSASR
jgi:hypothetical protein